MGTENGAKFLTAYIISYCYYFVNMSFFKMSILLLWCFELLLLCTNYCCCVLNYYRGVLNNYIRFLPKIDIFFTNIPPIVKDLTSIVYIIIIT